MSPFEIKQKAEKKILIESITSLFFVGIVPNLIELNKIVKVISSCKEFSCCRDISLSIAYEIESKLNNQ